jgi:hypothetical protein
MWMPTSLECPSANGPSPACGRGRPNVARRVRVYRARLALTRPRVQQPVGTLSLMGEGHFERAI